MPVVRGFEEDKAFKTCWGEKCADRSSPGCHSDTFPDFLNFGVGKRTAAGGKRGVQ